jgi:hypothetical protein
METDSRWWADPEFLRSGELGSYDFESFVYYLAASDDRGAVEVTEQHEYLHHLLAYSTNFGRLVVQARQELNASGAEPDRRLYRALLREARVVNEMVATYASVTQARPMAAADLPSGYKVVYDRCARLVEHAFESEQLRIAYSIALGRCLMMMRPSDAEVGALRTGALDRVPESSAPDKCLELAEAHLLSLPRDAVRSAVQNDVMADAATDDALLKRIAADDLLEPTLHRMLAEFLDPVLPGIDDAAAEFRMTRLIRLWPDDDRVRDPGVAETARAMTQQRVALWARSPRSIPYQERRVDEFVEVGASGVDSSWTHGVYVVVQRPQKTTEVAILNLRWRDDPPRARYLMLGDIETTALLHWPGPLVTLANEASLSTLDELDGDERLRGLLERGCFAHVAGNPVEFLLRCLGEGRAVKWFYGGVGYQTDAVGAEHALHIVVYVLEGIAAAFFHFSNTRMTAGLELFADRAVADATKVAMIGNDEAQRLPPTRLLSALLDHPLVLTHVRVGDRLPSDVRELTAAAEQAR